jgi:hypothetical protein
MALIAGSICSVANAQAVKGATPVTTAPMQIHATAAPTLTAAQQKQLQ